MSKNNKVAAQPTSEGVVVDPWRKHAALYPRSRFAQYSSVTRDANTTRLACTIAYVIY
jgi:hypothetical protein